MGRWAALRGAFATLQGVKFQVLTYAETQLSDLGISVEPCVPERVGELMKSEIARWAKVIEQNKIERQ